MIEPIEAEASFATTDSPFSQYLDSKVLIP